MQGTWEKDLIRGTLHFTATVIADNNATLEKYGVPDCYLGENSNIEANEHNLIEYGTCESALSGDPLLDSRWLGKTENSLNGNVYSTETHALQSESILIDAIPEVECNINVDQIGNLRPQGSGCDIGAYELPQEGKIFHLENLKVAYIVGGLLIITSIILVIFFRQKHKYRF